METVTNSMEILIKRVEDYGNTRIELAKLVAIDHTSTVISYLISNIIVVLVIFIFMLILSIGAAFWIGDALGAVYWGFLIVAGFYALSTAVLLLFFKRIKCRIKNTLIAHLYKPKQ